MPQNVPSTAKYLKMTEESARDERADEHQRDDLRAQLLEAESAIQRERQGADEDECAARELERRERLAEEYEREREGKDGGCLEQRRDDGRLLRLDGLEVNSIAPMYKAPEAAITRMAFMESAMSAGGKKPDERQHHHADERGEHHEDGGVAVLEKALDKIFVYMSRKRPKYRAGECEKEPHA